MIDAEDLLFVRVTRQVGVEFFRGFEVVAKGLLDDDALPMFAGFFAVEKLRVVEMLDHFGKLAWRRGEIKKQIMSKLFVAERFEVGGEFLVSARIRKVAFAVKQNL